MRVFRVFLAVLAIASAALPALAVSDGVKLVSTGDFTDKNGSAHSWKINGAHTLIWDGQPYVPVGGVFYSRYICTAQTDDNWKADVAALELLKSKGITDLLLKPVGPITWTKAEAWQKLVDYLDENGFTYGIDLSDGPKAPLVAYVVDPTRYRLADVVKDSVYTFDMPDVASAMWLLCSASTGSVLSNGGATVNGGKVEVNVKAGDQAAVLLLYPRKEFSGGARDGIGDLWSGYDEYRDRLVAFLSKLKFGKGLRFFVDPLSSKMDLTGDLSTLIPDSPDFRIEFESYLTRKFLNVGSINSGWALKSADIKSFQQAARLLPLWRGTKGVGALYDRATGQRYEVDPSVSTFWTDLISFRDSSAQSYLNSAADLVKRNAANVPVIYRAGSLHRVYSNSLSRGGFDGLGIEGYGHGIDLVANAAGPAYSMADSAARSVWLVVTGTEDTRRRDAASSGYPSDTSMAADLDYFRETGAKGMFVRALQMLPDDKDKQHSMLQVPVQLDWLKSFKDKFTGADRTDFAPTVVYYPVDPVVGASVTRLGPATWWLPSLRAGGRLGFGDTIGAYGMVGQDGICIWSRTTPTTLTFPVKENASPSVTFPADGAKNLSVNQKKKLATLKVGTTPIIITGLSAMDSFPVESADAAIARLADAVSRAKSSTMHSPPGPEKVKSAKDVLKNGRPQAAYEMATFTAQEILKDLGTYSWVEGEAAASHSFDSIGSGSGASDGGYLTIDQSSPPPMSSYSASYWMHITKESMHQIWLACRTPESGASPFSFSVDNGPWQSGVLSLGAKPYWSDFAWFMIGSANLTPGDHLIQIRLDRPNSAGIYSFGIDAVVASPADFKANGIQKP